MGNGVSVQGCDVVESVVVSQGRKSPAVFFGTMWSGEDQLLDEGLMIPSCSMWSNSSLAMRRRSGGRCSGGRRCALAVTGSQFVVIWCVTVCLTGWS